MATDFQTIPTIRTGTSLRTRNIWATPNTRVGVTGMFQINGSLSSDPGNSDGPVSLLRAGLVLGKITATGFYRPAIIGLTGATYTTSGSNTSVTVSAAVATEIARLITLGGGNLSVNFIGPPTTAGTVAITAGTITAASGTTLTLNADLGVNKIVGTIIAPADGSQSPVTILDNDISGTDVGVVNGDRTTAAGSVNQFLDPLIKGGDLIATQVVNLTEGDASVQTWIKAMLNGATTPSAASTTRGNFTFDNDR